VVVDQLFFLIWNLNITENNSQGAFLDVCRTFRAKESDALSID
jgi:hypothetical protein